MARAVKQVVNLFTFVKGKVNDANDLTSIKGGIRKSDNIDVLRDGSARRRRGLDYEIGYALSSELISNVEFSSMSYGIWSDVAGNGELNIIAIQFGLFIHLYSIDTNTVSSGFIAKLDLSTFVVNGQVALASASPMEFVSGKGILFVASEYIEPLTLTYDANTSEITIQAIDIQIRDFTGVDDGLAIDANPSSLSELHEYNLMNQGWIDTVDSGVGTGGSFPITPIIIVVLV